MAMVWRLALLFPAKSVVVIMGTNDQCYSKKQEKIFIRRNELLCNEEYESCKEKRKGKKRTVVGNITMV